MKLYWIGPGVFSHGGKDYEHGAELPGLDKDTAARLVKKNLAAGEVPRVGRPTSEAAQLREQLALMEKANGSLKAGYDAEREKARAAFADLTSERDQLAAQLKDAQATIDALAGQLADVRKEADDVAKAAAGPKEDKKK